MLNFTWLDLWQVNLVFYLFFAVIFNQFYKISIKNNVRDGASVVLLQIICALSFLFLIPLFPWKLATDYHVYLMLLLAIVFYTINDRTQATARQGLPVSEFLMITQLSKVFLIIAGIVVFREPFVITKIFGASLILIGNFVLLFKKKQFVINKYVAWALLATLTISIAMTIDLGLINQFNMPFYLLFSFLIPAVLIMFFEKISFSDIKREFTHDKRHKYLITGVAWCGAVFFMYRSFVLGQVSLVAPLTTLNILLNILFSYFVFKEKENILRNLLVSILIIFGVYITVF